MYALKPSRERKPPSRRFSKAPCRWRRVRCRRPCGSRFSSARARSASLTPSPTRRPGRPISAAPSPRRLCPRPTSCWRLRPRSRKSIFSLQNCRDRSGSKNGGIHCCGATVPNCAHLRPNLPAHQNHTPTKLDNSSFLVEYFDEEGQCTDVKTANIETASSLQRGFSPEVEI